MIPRAYCARSESDSGRQILDDARQTDLGGGPRINNGRCGGYSEPWTTRTYYPVLSSPEISQLPPPVKRILVNTKKRLGLKEAGLTRIRW